MGVCVCSGAFFLSLSLSLSLLSLITLIASHDDTANTASIH